LVAIAIDQLYAAKILIFTKMNLSFADTYENNNMTPLYSAVEYKRPLEFIQLLLNRGADINKAAINNWTALNLASDQGSIETVQLLLDNGADFTIPNDKGWAPINSAAYA